MAATNLPEPGEALTLSAQHLRVASVTVDAHTTALFLTDGEEAVEVSHEIGNPLAAAARIADAGLAMLAHAEAIRRNASAASAQRDDSAAPRRRT